MRLPTDIEPQALDCCEHRSSPSGALRRSPKHKRKRPFKAAVLFCGAGGDTAGTEEALREMQQTPDFTLINHWEVATNTIGKNFPDARILTTGIDAVNPRTLFAEGELKFLWASPECTHHSVARGGKPIKDQSRATAWCVPRWAEACQPDIIWVENVKEFRNWGPLIRKRVVVKPIKIKSKMTLKKRRTALNHNRNLNRNRRTQLVWVPNPKRKGELFRAWIAALEAVGYRVDHRVICCADYGDPTTRERLFVQCVRKASRKNICWPNPTHCAPERDSVSRSTSEDLFGVRQPWATAENAVIDWSLPGKSIFERPIPHADNTLRRIMIGFLRGLEHADLSAFTGARDVPQRCGPLAAFTIGQQSDAAGRSVKQPVATVSTAGAIALAEPRIVKLRGTCNTAPVEKPVPSLTTGRHIGLMQPQIVEVNHGKDGGKSDAHRIKSIKQPLGTVTGSRGVGLAEFVLQTDQTGGNGACVRTPDQPVGTIVTKANLAVVQATLKPYLVNSKGRSNDSAIDEPVPTVTAHAKHLNLAQPFIVPQFSSQGPRGVNRPMPTVTTQSRGIGLADPYLVPFHGERHKQESRRHSIKQPVPTVPCSPTLALAEPFVLPREGVHRGNASRPVTKPFPTATTNGGGLLIQPQVIKFYGTGGAKSVRLPLDTVTTKERFGLVEFLITQVKKKNRPIVEVNGQAIGYLEILFRMFQWYELALAQGFRPGYQFTGNVEQIVKQIGNAVPRRTVRALVKASLSQNAKV